jgi:hypothetical protein
LTLGAPTVVPIQSFAIRTMRWSLALPVIVWAFSPTPAAAQWPPSIPAGGIASYPAVSPDGQHIVFAFLSGPDTVSQLHSIRFD